MVKVTFATLDTSQGKGGCVCDNRITLNYGEGLSVAGVAGCGSCVSVHVTRRGLAYISVPLKESGFHVIRERLTVLLAGFAKWLR